MARPRTIKIANLNIAMHNPHSPERYVELFNDVFARGGLAKSGSLHGSIIGSLMPEDRDDIAKGINGELFRFVILDPNEPWFNTVTRDVATAAEAKEIVIPKHLLPHLQRIPFVFRPDAHQLWFVSHDRKDNLGPAAAASIFQTLIDQVCLEKGYPTVEVTPVPDEDILERMLALHTLEKLSIELKRPNSDDGLSEEQRWQKRLERQKAKRMKVELVAERSESIKPDEETRGLARAAAHNGKVSVIGRTEDGMKVEESTEKHPRIDPVTVDPENETILGVLRRFAGL